MHLRTLLTSLEQPPLAFHTPDQAPFPDNVEITALAYDSRQVQTGGLFLAMPGDHTDGRRFLADAAQRGAVVALGEPLQHNALASLPLPYVEVRDVRIALANLACAFYEFPASHLCTIGVTGTCGKTTTSNLISALLEASTATGFTMASSLTSFAANPTGRQLANLLVVLAGLAATAAVVGIYQRLREKSAS